MTIRLKPEVVVITLTNLHHEVGHDLSPGGNSRSRLAVKLNDEWRLSGLADERRNDRDEGAELMNAFRPKEIKRVLVAGSVKLGCIFANVQCLFLNFACVDARCANPAKGIR